MGTVVHTSRISIVRERGPTRIARIEGSPEPVYYGVHGGIKDFYRVEPEKEHAACPLPSQQCCPEKNHLRTLFYAVKIN
jgi:hypothetical protein